MWGGKKDIGGECQGVAFRSCHPIHLAKVWVFALAWFAFSISAFAVVDWPVLSFVQATTNSLSQPTSITHAGDGSQRMFITERIGRIRILQGSNVLTQPFLDIT